MTYKDDIIRLREQEALALRKKVEELEAKIEILTSKLINNEVYE